MPWLAVMLAVALWSEPAHAYLDPGMGSMILQLFLGGVAGVAVACKFYWHKVTSVLGSRKRTAPPEKKQTGEP
jgi:hypothetical protein